MLLYNFERTVSNLKKNETKKGYLPHERDYLEDEPKSEKSCSKYDYTILPDNVQDPIVANNIANVEFNYTYNEDEEIFNDDLFQELDNQNIEK